MQDRSPPLVKIFLLRTAGPYIGVIHVAINQECPSIRFRYAPKADVAAGKCREWSIR